MNPLLLLLLGFGGFMAASGFGSSNNDDVESAEEPVGTTDDDTIDDDPAPAPTPVEPEVTSVALTMVIWNMASAEVVTEVEDGESIDFGTALVDDYTFAVEADAEIGSVTLTYNGETYLQNIYPYTLEDSPLDLAEGDFDVTVTAYSGPNATGDVLGTETISFSTTSEEPEVIVEEEELQIDDEIVEEDDSEEEVVEDEEEEEEDVVEEDDGEEEEEVVEEEDGEEEEVEAEAASLTLTAVIFDDVNRTIVQEIADGEVVDFGSDDIRNYIVAVEADAEIGSMILTYNGENYLQNIAPYTLDASVPVLAEAEFDFSVTVYSGPNGTGEILGTESFSFATTSDAPVIEEDEEEDEEEVVVEEDNGEEEVVDEEIVEEEEEEEEVVEDEDDDDDDGIDVDQGDIETPVAPDQSGDGGSGGENNPVASEDSIDVLGGRVTTIDPEGDDIASVRIVSGLEHGHVTVNPDNTIAVVLTLTDFTGKQSFTYETTDSSGDTSRHTVELDIEDGPQEEGWATGSSNYVLATDEDDRAIIETGDNHTKVHITGSSDAITLADIARMEGVNVNELDWEWFTENEVPYGKTEDLALDEEAGLMVWHAVTPEGSVTSNHLLMERGYEYAFDSYRIMERGAEGESAIKPIYWGAYGEGEKPVITTKWLVDGDGVSNIVVQDLHFVDGVGLQAFGPNRSANSDNVMFDHNKFTEGELTVQYTNGITVRYADITDVHKEDPVNGQFWDSGADRASGIFGNYNNGLLLEHTFIDMAGWEEGYNYNGGGTGTPQPPTMFSHGVYFGDDNIDVTVTDNIISRGASIGLMVRSSGYIEDNAMIDNNIGIVTLGGDYRNSGGTVDNYTYLADNLVTSAAYKEAEYESGRPKGIVDAGAMSTLVDNIVTHLANPDDPDELASKPITDDALYLERAAYYDDTIIWNWKGANDTGRVTEQNVDGLDTNVLDETTIQNFTAQLLGQDTATIEDLANYLRAQADGAFDDIVDADLIIRFFQEGFGIAPDIRLEAETLRFAPSDLAEGVRWDNRLNWTTEDLPGTVDGDSVDLVGNTVIYNDNAEIDELEFGDGGRLELYGGKLTTTGELTTNDGEAEVFLTNAGQLWADGHSGQGLDVTIEAGRFANTGAVRDLSLEATGGETLLATGGAIWGISDGETLSITGDQKVGFDDDDGGVALLSLEEGGTLHFEVEDGKLSTIEEFRSGAFGDSPDVRSGIDLGDGTLKLDLAGLNASNGQELMLLDADEIIGAFDDVDVSGLGGRDATITIDYVTDSVSLTLSNGNGNVMFETIGEADDVSAGEQALWDALTAGQGVFDENTPDPEIPEDEAEYLAAS